MSKCKSKEPNIKDSTILIVGGSKGIGLEIAKAATSRYRRIVVVSRSSTLNDKVDIETISADMNEVGCAQRIMHDVAPNVLILCAAKGLFQSTSATEDQILDITRTTFISPLTWLSVAMECMSEGDSIGWISSLTGRVISTNWAVYGASKAGVEHFIQSQRALQIEKGISVTVCYPGCVATDFHRDAGTESPACAVHPETVAEPILKAIQERRQEWVAPMDRRIITTLDLLRATSIFLSRRYLK